MTEVDFDRLLEVKDEFVDYEGVLPLLIRAVILKKWSNNLNKKGLWIDVNKECVATKPKSYREAVDELVEWCNKNQKYDSLIKNRME